MTTDIISSVIRLYFRRYLKEYSTVVILNDKNNDYSLGDHRIYVFTLNMKNPPVDFPYEILNDKLPDFALVQQTNGKWKYEVKKNTGNKNNVSHMVKSNKEYHTPLTALIDLVKDIQRKKVSSDIFSIYNDKCKDVKECWPEIYKKLKLNNPELYPL